MRLSRPVGIGLALAILASCVGRETPGGTTATPPQATRSPAPSPESPPGPQPQTTPTDETHPPEEIDPPAAGKAATRLGVTTGCAREDPGKSTATFRWRPTLPPGDHQRLDLTEFLEGFETGRFKSSERLAPGVSRYTWVGLEPFGYRWRVLTRHGKAWTSSREAAFSGPVCVADQIDGG